MTSELCNPEYYRGTFLEIWKSMEVREEGMEVQEEAAYFTITGVHPVNIRPSFIFPEQML